MQKIALITGASRGIGRACAKELARNNIKVIANYKLAVPQYFNGKIQLLIPLYFSKEEKPDLTLVLTKMDGYYQAHTCLTMEMAYNNARLIAKPDSSWLVP